ncbi:MAG: hypothetical protein DBY08_03375 [Clostridiales bacterium]|nr:MAG: hypothetical protein DBY08_03375 [Clostridiales bacterium]
MGGNERKHLRGIENPNHLLLIFKKENKTVGCALVRLNKKSEIFELRRIAISEKRKEYGREAMEAPLTKPLKSCK